MKDFIEKYSVVFLFIGIALIFLSSIFILDYWINEKYKINDIRIGQTWINISGDPDNPFEDPDTTFYKILNYKNGFVKYQWEGKYTRSTKDDVFVLGYELFKEPIEPKYYHNVLIDPENMKIHISDPKYTVEWDTTVFLIVDPGHYHPIGGYKIELSEDPIEWKFYVDGKPIGRATRDSVEIYVPVILK